jgi:hypothetical protein
VISASTPVVQELNTLRSHIEALRTRPRDRIEFDYGFENAATISMRTLDAEPTLLGAIRASIEMPNPTWAGAAWARVEPRVNAADSQALEVARVIPRMQSAQQDFVSGFADALEVDVPGTATGTSMQIALAYGQHDLTPLQRGAIHRRLLDQLLMEHIEWRLRGYIERDAMGDMARGFASPDPDSVPGLPYPFTLADISRQLSREETTQEQAGMLHYFAQELANDLRLARVTAIRHRMITGSQFADYLDGYLNPPADEADFLHAIGHPASIDSLHELFVQDAASARRRGEIARYMARFESESEAAIYQETVLARVFAAAQATRRIPFAQTLIPSMLKGLVGGDCFSSSLIMSVAMRRGATSIDVFSRRMRAFEILRTPPAEAGQVPVPRTLSLESRNVLSAMASLALRQPGTSGELIAGEMVRVASGVQPRNVAAIVHEAALLDGHEDHVMVTSEHAMALRVATDGGNPRAALNFLFYEPNYGLLEFDRYESFDGSLRVVGEAPYYRRTMFGADPGVDIYRINVPLLERVKVCGNLRVRDLVREPSFVRARDRAAAAEARAIRGRQGALAGTSGSRDSVDAGTQTGEHAVGVGTQTDVHGATGVDTLARADAGTQTDVQEAHEGAQRNAHDGMDVDGEPNHMRRRSLDGNDGAGLGR